VSERSRGHWDVTVAIFAFNRPTHLQRLVDSLDTNPLFPHLNTVIFCDGPRNDQDSPGVQETRLLARKWIAERGWSGVFRERNLGLSNSVISGVTRCLEMSYQVIVLEDDLEVGPHFLSYMTRELARFQEDQRISSISGYTLPALSRKSPRSAGFLRGAECWGWGTWKDRWGEAVWDSEMLLTSISSNLLTSFQFKLSSQPRSYSLLKRQSEGDIDSWAIRWHASNWIAGRRYLFPPVSHVRNTGHDGSGTHSGSTSKYDTVLSQSDSCPKIGTVRTRTADIARMRISECRQALVDYLRVLSDPAYRWLRSFRGGRRPP